MNESMKNKAKRFWAKNKYKIIAVVALLGFATYEIVKHSQTQPTDEEIEEVVLDALDEEYENPIEEESSFEKRQKDPKYQLDNGGWVTDDYEMEDFHTKDGQTIAVTEMIINDVPVENLGVFGGDIQKKFDELYPDHKPVTDVSMIIDLRNDPSFKKEEPAA